MSVLADYITEPGLTVFSKEGDGCTQCKNTIRTLEAQRVPFTEIKVSDEDDNFREVAKSLGYRSFPIVTNDDETHQWSGFNPRKISAYAKEVVKKS